MNYKKKKTLEITIKNENKQGRSSLVNYTPSIICRTVTDVERPSTLVSGKVHLDLQHSPSSVWTIVTKTLIRREFLIMYLKKRAYKIITNNHRAVVI